MTSIFVITVGNVPGIKIDGDEIKGYPTALGVGKWIIANRPAVQYEQDVRSGTIVISDEPESIFAVAA